MKPDSVERFAREWIEDWNTSDLDGLLAHYRDDVVFSSPRAQALTGSAQVEGKEALRAYWGAATARASSRRFTLDRHIWDAGRNELVILYENQVDGASTRACEVFHFDDDGLVDHAEALYGASSQRL
jgi:steroid delta-isomerase